MYNKDLEFWYFEVFVYNIKVSYINHGEILLLLRFYLQIFAIFWMGLSTFAPNRTNIL